MGEEIVLRRCAKRYTIDIDIVGGIFFFCVFDRVRTPGTHAAARVGFSRSFQPMPGRTAMHLLAAALLWTALCSAP